LRSLAFFVPGALLIALAAIVLASLKMVRQWEQAVVLRAGKFLAVRGPGLFWMIPIVDSIAAVIDTRIRTPQFLAEQTLSKDTVPVDVDAIIFWIVTESAQPSKSQIMVKQFLGLHRPHCGK
jgi:regulator of protease activity HflC (stomatin/prohibitin superfamily)